MSFLLDLFFSLPWSSLEQVLLGVVERRSKNIVPCQDSNFSTLEPKPKQTLPSFSQFASDIIKATKTLPVTLLGSLVYLERLSKCIPSKAYGHKETSYRLFLTSLVLSGKVLVDGALKNDYWAKSLQPSFTLQELNLMESQFLHFIDYDLDLKREHLEEIIVNEPDIYKVVCSAPTIYCDRSIPFEGPWIDRTPAIKFAKSDAHLWEDPLFGTDSDFNINLPPSPASIDTNSWPLKQAYYPTVYPYYYFPHQTSIDPISLDNAAILSIR